MVSEWKSCLTAAAAECMISGVFADACDARQPLMGAAVGGGFI